MDVSWDRAATAGDGADAPSRATGCRSRAMASVTLTAGAAPSGACTRVPSSRASLPSPSRTRCSRRPSSTMDRGSACPRSRAAGDMCRRAWATASAGAAAWAGPGMARSSRSNSTARPPPPSKACQRSAARPMVGRLRPGSARRSAACCTSQPTSRGPCDNRQNRATAATAASTAIPSIRHSAVQASQASSRTARWSGVGRGTGGGGG